MQAANPEITVTAVVKVVSRALNPSLRNKVGLNLAVVIAPA
jgi:hypothetical protein